MWRERNASRTGRFSGLEKKEALLSRSLSEKALEDVGAYAEQDRESSAAPLSKGKQINYRTLI